MAFSFFERVPDGESISLWATGSRNIAGYAIVKKANKADEYEECIVDADGDDIDTLHDTTYGHLYETEKDATEAAIVLFDSEEKGWRDIVFIAKVEYALTVRQVQQKAAAYKSQGGTRETVLARAKLVEADLNPDDTLDDVDLDEDVGIEPGNSGGTVDPAKLVQKETTYIPREKRTWYRLNDNQKLSMGGSPTSVRRLDACYEAGFLGEELSHDDQVFYARFELR